MDPQGQQVAELLRESESELLKFSRAEFEFVIKKLLHLALMTKFKKNFWRDERGIYRDWKAIKEAEIRNLFKLKSSEGINSINAFESFDFPSEITPSIRKGPADKKQTEARYLL